MPVAVAHLGICESADLPPPIHTARLEKNILGLAAMRAGVHPQCTADRAGNAAIKGKSIDARIGRRTRELHVGNGSAGAEAMSVLDYDFAKGAATETNDGA